jgi:hypothetical protein
MSFSQIGSTPEQVEQEARTEVALLITATARAMRKQVESGRLPNDDNYEGLAALVAAMNGAKLVLHADD